MRSDHPSTRPSQELEAHQLQLLMEAANLLLTLELDRDGIVRKGTSELFGLLGITHGSPLLRQWICDADKQRFDNLVASVCNQENPPVETFSLSGSSAGGVDLIGCKLLATAQGNPPSGIKILLLPESKTADPNFQIVHHKLLSLGTLTAGVAHDLNNLFTGVLAFLDVLDSQVLDVNHKRYLKLINNSITTGIDLAHGLMNLLKEEQGPVVPIDPISCIRQLCRLVRPNLRPGIQLITHFPSRTHSHIIRRSHLTQLMLNLILNARDAIEEPGKILVQAYFAPVENPTELIITVRDSGQGMSPEKVQRVFTPLFTTKADTGGTGMGLTIVNTIVQKNGGSIHIDSQQGKYSLFTVRLPLVPDRVKGS